MNRLPFLKTIALVIAAVALFGCKSKQEPQQAGPQQGAQQGAPVKSISGERASGAVTSSPQDKADAEAAAKHVLDQMESGDFAGIYQEAGPTFKQIGPEANFVHQFQATRQKTGPLSGAKEASFVTRPDQICVIVYHLENDRFKTERRLSFARGKNGKMELVGLNQHDEPKNLRVK